MKISKEKLVQIIKEELDDYQISMAQDDPEEFLAGMKSRERIKQIDILIAELQREKEMLLLNIDSGENTFDQSNTRSPNEQK